MNEEVDPAGLDELRQRLERVEAAVDGV